MIRCAAGLTLLLALVACADNPQAPIEERSAGRGSTASKTAAAKPDYGKPLIVGPSYRVRLGDTLYAIAFRLGMDFQTLAAMNGIEKPYIIQPGQTIKTVRPRSSIKSASAKPVASSTKTTKTTKTTTTPKTTTPTIVKSAASGKTAPKATPKATVPKTQSTASPSSNSNSRKTLGPVRKWRWPSAGRVVRSYSTNLHKGIDISGRRGDAVSAVAAGIVVYAGTGVTGYGALLIVKHNDEYLSAYGHNDALLVEEGAYVKAGQRIARVGSSGTDTVKLHFEIRRNGKPVDPLKLLPKR